MGSCCNDIDACSIDTLRDQQRGTLRIVLGINAVMFLIIAVAALYGRSSALLSDSLDNLGDALTYGLSLYAVSRSGTTKAKVALFKGGLIFLAACGVAVQIVSKLIHPSVPSFEVMGGVQPYEPRCQLVLSLSSLAPSRRRCQYEFGMGMLAK